jgi:hypothetical protein
VAPSGTTLGEERPAGAWAAASRIAPVALLAALGAGMLAWTWGTWPDVQVDFGRELYIPWQLLEGRRLYVDLAYLNGPLSPHLNALWFLLLGVGLDRIVAVNLVLVLATAVLLFHLVGRAANRLAATAACAAFLLLFAFGQLVPVGNYNHVCPYSHETVHGLVAALAALAAALGFVRSGRPRWLLLAGFLLGLAFLTRPEPFVAAAVAVGFGLALHLAPLGRGPLVKALGALLLGGILPPMLAVALLGLRMPLGVALEGTLGPYLTVLRHTGEQLFYRHGMGVDEPWVNLAAMLLGAGRYLLVLGPAAGLALLLGRRRPAATAVLAASSFAVAGASFWLLIRDDWKLVARGWPLLLLLAGAGALARLLRQGRGTREAERAWLGVVLLLFALSLLAKMILRARIYQYGFTLALPAAAALLAAGLSWAPAALRRRGATAALLAAACLGLLAATVAAHLSIAGQFLALKKHRVGGAPLGDGRDAFLADWRGPMIEAALRRVSMEEPGDTLLVLPEGVMVNYLARRPSPTRHVNFMPFELAVYGEASILEELRARPPGSVLLVHKDTREYGPSLFGIDYGRDLMTFVRAGFRPVARWGEPPLRRGTRFGCELWLRAPRGVESPPSSPSPTPFAGRAGRGIWEP